VTSSVLVVEDDPLIAASLSRALRSRGYDAPVAGTVASAVASLSTAPPDLVLLDLGLPDGDGAEVCERVTRSHPDVPVIVLTARSDEIDVVLGLEMGAVDYVAKPFRLAELLARVRSQLRRGTAEQFEAADVKVDVASRKAWRGERELELSPKEFDLLALLVREAGRVVTRERIMSEVWDENWFGSTKTLDMHVSWLRRKLGDDADDPRLLVTVRGVGLRFEP
jgi:DNA-binding response OmpR family regulator